jgi:hypothetical protein
METTNLFPLLLFFLKICKMLNKTNFYFLIIFFCRETRDRNQRKAKKEMKNKLKMYFFLLKRICKIHSLACI